MEFEGIIKQSLGVKSGTSESGKEWKIASYVAETDEQYPQRMVFDVWDGSDGRIARLNLEVDKKYKLYLGFEAKQYDGKWYNKISCWNARLIES